MQIMRPTDILACARALQTGAAIGGSRSSLRTERISPMWSSEVLLRRRRPVQMVCTREVRSLAYSERPHAVCCVWHDTLLYWLFFASSARARHDSTVTWQRNLPPIEKGARIHAYVT